MHESGLVEWQYLNSKDSLFLLGHVCVIKNASATTRLLLGWQA